MLAYGALSTLQVNPNDQQAVDKLKANQENIGYGLLLKHVLRMLFMLMFQ